MDGAQNGAERHAMTTTESHWRSRNPWAAARASLIPWAAFLVAAAVADMWVHQELSAIALAAAAPWSLGFVALPAMVPLVVARAGATRAGVLIVMTAVATISAVLVVTTDDAQAGLAVLWVPFLAIPLATVVWIGRAVAARRNRSTRSRGDN